MRHVKLFFFTFSNSYIFVCSHIYFNCFILLNINKFINIIIYIRIFTHLSFCFASCCFCLWFLFRRHLPEKPTFPPPGLQGWSLNPAGTQTMHGTHDGFPMGRVWYMYRSMSFVDVLLVFP